MVDRQLSDLPDNEVLIDVKYSSLNYKDGLSATGNPGVTRVFPHTPGIDASGVVLESRDKDFTPGDEVIVIGLISVWEHQGDLQNGFVCRVVGW